MNDVKTLKTTVNGQEFDIAPTYEQTEDCVLTEIADQMLRELNGSRCVNSEIEFILKHSIEDYDNAPFCYDDITNSGPTGEIENLEGDYITMNEEERDQFVSELEDQLVQEEENGSDQELLDKIQSLIDQANYNYIEDYPEIMQWFALDERLIYRLEKMGQCTLVGEYWGRQAYGQSITMDHCIKKVCYDLAFAWSK